MSEKRRSRIDNSEFDTKFMQPHSATKKYLYKTEKIIIIKLQLEMCWRGIIGKRCGKHTAQHKIRAASPFSQAAQIINDVDNA